MRIIRLALVLAGALAAAGAQAAGRRALLVGIGRYPEAVSSGARGGWRSLGGARNDVAAVRDLLIARYGFRREDLTILQDGEATREAILAAFRRLLVSPAAPGDVALFYYAGHGSWMRNSLSREPDRRDETIVPFDGADIRDKELARLMAEAAARGLTLTAVFDSCHSGSISRGISVARGIRAAPPALDRDARDPAPAPTPSQSGVLVLSASQDGEGAAEVLDRNGVTHGAFTAAFLEVLRTSSPAATAETVFLRIRGLLRGGGVAQEPVLDGSPARRRAPLFGPSERGADGRLMVAIGEVAAGRVEILAGLAVGMAPGTVLVREGAEPRVRLVVDEVPELSRSLGHLASPGAAVPVAPGDLFTVERWAAPERSPVRVHLGPPMPAAQVRAASRALRALRHTPGLRWISDPSELAPTHVLFRGPEGWRLRWPDGREEAVGDAPRAADIARRLERERGDPRRAPPCDARPCLYVRLPVPAEMEAHLAGDAASDGVVTRLSEEADALYLLAGRVGRRGEPEYAWILASARSTPLPPRSEWRSDAAPDPEGAAAGLEQAMFQIARVHAWLTLEAPPAIGEAFPYRLALEHQGSALRVESGRGLRRGQSYDPVLVASPEALARGSAVRHVYVLVLDSSGHIGVLYPPDGVSLDNRLPAADPGEPLPGRIALEGGRFRVVEPLGSDTYVLLATERPLPAPSELEQEAVTRGAGRGADDLFDFLTGAGPRGSPSRAGAWSIDRLAAPSVP